jgi:hypothetical protein
MTYRALAAGSVLFRRPGSASGGGRALLPVGLDLRRLRAGLA